MSFQAVVYRGFRSGSWVFSLGAGMIASVLTVSCSSGTEEESESLIQGLSCEVTTSTESAGRSLSNTCIDFAGATAVNAARDLCDDQVDSTFHSDQVCSSENLVGTCSYASILSATGEALEIRFYSPDWTAGDAEDYCDSASGTFHAPPDSGARSGMSCAYGSTGPLSGDYTFANTCLDFAGATSGTTAQETCSGDYDLAYSSSEGCPTDGLIGTCSYTASQSVTEESLEIRFYSDGWSASEAEGFCDSASGVWAAE
jgi:hypothetical protein